MLTVATENTVPMPVPENLDYERWLGSAPEQPYMEGRVHPQNDPTGRPGWITTEDLGLGMSTNWGAHHVDIAPWARPGTRPRKCLSVMRRRTRFAAVRRESRNMILNSC